jgi:hypothetical protein
VRPRTSLVVTTIAGPTPALAALAAGAAEHGTDFVLIGDEASPAGFELSGADYFDLERQRALDLRFPTLCPTRRYSRKNVGYLVAMRRGAEIIVETDDDTVAHDAFWGPREAVRTVRRASGAGWLNLYRYFTDANIWPRGLPLDAVRSPQPPAEAFAKGETYCPIQQGLVDDDPDVDAVYRLVLELPFRFDPGEPIGALGGTLCPFNSQNTAWWPDAFPLLYLPSYCSFRLADIWRSFVALRISAENGWGVLFHGPTVRHERNAHNLMSDFGEEVPGYLGNRRICETLAALDIRPGPEGIPHNLRLSYRALVEGGWVGAEELPLLDAWLEDAAG